MRRIKPGTPIHAGYRSMDGHMRQVMDDHGLSPKEILTILSVMCAEAANEFDDLDHVEDVFQGWLMDKSLPPEG